MEFRDCNQATTAREKGSLIGKREADAEDRPSRI